MASRIHTYAAMCLALSLARGPDDLCLRCHGLYSRPEEVIRDVYVSERLTRASSLAFRLLGKSPVGVSIHPASWTG
jgi:hypothetical protein